MAYNISSLADYVAGNGELLMTNILLGSRSFELLRVEEGIKSSEKRPDLLDDVTAIQTGDYTSLTRFSGGTKINEVTISVVPMWISEKYDSRLLSSKLTQLAMRAGTNPDDLPYESAIMGLKTDTIRLYNEKHLWQGVAGASGSTYNLFDGFLKVITGATATLKTGQAVSGMTSTNALAIVNSYVDKMKSSLPQFVDIETRLFCSPANFMTYYQAVFGLQGALNSLTINTGAMPSEVRIAGTNIILTSVPGLDGQNQMVLTRPDNLIIGTDLVSEDDRLSFEYHPVIKSWELFGAWKLGAQVARPGEVIIAG